MRCRTLLRMLAVCAIGERRGRGTCRSQQRAQVASSVNSLMSWVCILLTYVAPGSMGSDMSQQKSSCSDWEEQLQPDYATSHCCPARVAMPEARCFRLACTVVVYQQ
jgi:hypothetical protein